MNGEHKLAVVLWGAYSIIVGTLGILYHQFDQWVAVTILTAAVGNSAHLISVAVGSYFTAKSSQANAAQNNKLN